MANLATALKAEIARIARKELKGETTALKKAAATYRSEIALLKRRAQTLEQEVRRMKNGPSDKPSSASRENEDDQKSVRFSAKGLASQRKRLGLSASDLGLLIGTTSQSVYNWEEGKSKPRGKYMPAIAALRTLGKKAATARLEATRAAPGNSVEEQD
ncbi:DNA-binding transcriptional regulator [Rhizobacter sp. Root404]|uniref:helix-turn-helix domain-containing protein n=1 Tax=Rhizobacter sp. Root404 TaxID=1736528 RepID=UPI0009EB9170|nr:helix-turn-helix domain-containing protein [Rhizobacter sp. Root404]